MLNTSTFDAHVKSTGEVEQTEYQPLPTKGSIEQSLEKHGLTEDCWLRNALISTLEQTGFDQLPANLDPAKLEESLEVNFFQTLFTKEWLRFSLKKYFKCDDEELAQKIDLDDRFSIFMEELDKDDALVALRRSRYFRKELSHWVQRAKSVIRAPTLKSRLVFLEKILTHPTKEFTEEFWQESILALGDSTGEAALARLAISDFAPPTFCGKLFDLASQDTDFPFNIDFEFRPDNDARKRMSKEEWEALTEEEKFEAHTVHHHGYWDLLSMTNWALENSLPAGEAQALEEAYANDEPQLVEEDAGFVIVYEFPDLKRGTFWHLFTHLYDYCNSESLGVGIDFEFGPTDETKFVQYCHGDDDEAPDRYLRQWPRIELRIPEGMIEKESPYYLYPEMPDEWMPAGTTHGTRWGCGDERKRVPFRRLQRAYRRAISENF